MATTPTNGTSGTSESTPLLSPAGAQNFIKGVSESASKSFGEISSSASRSIGEIKVKADQSVAGIQAKTREVFSEENVGMVKQVASEKFHILKESAMTGNISIRYCALFAGTILLLTAIIGFIKDAFFLLSFAPALVELYAILLGLLILVLESKGNKVGTYQVPTAWIDELHKYALFLKYVWGRGVLYAVAGSLQTAQGTRGDVIVGCMVMVVGLLYVYAGYTAAQKFLALGESNAVSEAELQAKFAEIGVTELNCDQFWDLVVELGLDLKRPEVETAFLHMDKNKSDTVSYDEIKTWFKAGSGTALDV